MKNSSQAPPPAALIPLTYSFFCRATQDVARELLGKLFVYHDAVGWLGGRIVETEAYLGREDPACHSCRSMTPRNQVMFGPAGRSYIYRSYGIHLCYNITTDTPDRPAAVLLRALEPLWGLEEMGLRRPKASWQRYCAGPGNLTRALGLTMDLNGVSVLDPAGALVLYDDGTNDVPLRITPRIGISQAQDWPLRFCWEGHPCLSRR